MSSCKGEQIGQGAKVQRRVRGGAERKAAGEDELEIEL